MVNADKNEVPKLVFHYTKCDTALKILESNSLRLTHYGFLNDYQEMVCGMAWAEVAVEDAHRKVKGKYFSASQWEELKERLKAPPVAPVFVGCFSEMSDSLAQWRAYADDGSGVAIGFRTSSLDKITRGSPKYSSFGKVLYGQEACVSSMAGIVRRSVSSKRKTDFDKAMHRISHMLLYDRLLTNSPYFKQKEFDEEKEWRWVVHGVPAPEKLQDIMDAGENPQNWDPEDVDAILHLSEQANWIKLHMMATGGTRGIQPGLKLTFPQEAIAEVILGPRLSSAQQLAGAKYALLAYGYDLRKVNVQVSSASYR